MGSHCGPGVVEDGRVEGIYAAVHLGGQRMKRPRCDLNLRSPGPITESPTSPAPSVTRPGALGRTKWQPQ